MDNFVKSKIFEFHWGGDAEIFSIQNFVGQRKYGGQKKLSKALLAFMHIPKIISRWNGIQGTHPHITKLWNKIRKSEKITRQWWDLKKNTSEI